MSSTQIAVVGCGPWGTNLAQKFATLGNLAVVVDAIPSRAEGLAVALQVRSSDWKTCMEDPAIAAIALATPAATHAVMAIEALNAGKHVFVEKPLALSTLDGERVLDAAEKAGKVVNVGHLFHYHPAFLALKSMILEGSLGQLRQIHSTRLAPGRIRHEENAFWSLAPHDVSMILALNGGIAPISMAANGSFHLRNSIADVVNAYLVFPNGVNAQINVSWIYPERERKLVAIGDKGMAIFDDCQPWTTKLRVFPHIVEWHEGIPEAKLASLVDVENVALDAAEPLLEECRSFIASIEQGHKSANDVHEGLKVLCILSGVQDSLEEARTHPQSRSFTRLENSTSVQVTSVHKTTVVDEGCSIGDGTSISHFSHIKSGARIGSNCKIGQSVMIGCDVVIGDRCKIKENVSVYEAVQLEDGVFCGPSCVFTNVLNPRAEVERKSQFLPTIVRRGATIGANATIVCGVELGEYCMVGAGSVVVKSVIPYALVVGNPARQIGWASAAGETLGPGLTCRVTGIQYRVNGGLLLPVPAAIQNPQKNELSQEPAFKGEAIQLVDLQAQKSRLKDVNNRVSQVINSGNFIMGPEVSDLEKKLAEYTQAAHVISCASGTDALTIALMALELCPGDAVLVPTFTFVATVEPIALLRAIPIFVDIDPVTFTLDPNLIAAGIEAARKAGHRPVGMIAVDLFGHPADYTKLSAAAASHDLWVVADASQSFGASINGRKVGTLAKITTTSFFPSKPLGCYGDGGSAFTNDEGLAGRMRSIRLHGRSQEDKFDNVRIGLNSRLDTIQAAVLMAKLELFPQEMEARQTVSERYHRLLNGIVTTPEVSRGVRSAWAAYTVRSTDRDGVRKRLRAQSIDTAIYYPRPIHTQRPYSDFPVIEGGCPVATLACAQVLSLPMHPYLEAALQEHIVAIAIPEYARKIK